jgi:hypothetical protein
MSAPEISPVQPSIIYCDDRKGWRIPKPEAC